MDAECKAIEKKMQSEVDQFKTIQKGEIRKLFASFAACFPHSQIFLHWAWLSGRPTDQNSFVYQNVSNEFSRPCTDFSKLVQQRELLDGQLNENKSVLEELNLLKDDNQVSVRRHFQGILTGVKPE